MTLPTRSAIVTIDGEPSLDFDPVMLNIEMYHYADAFDASLIAILDGIEQYMAEAQDVQNYPGVSLVWEEDRKPVMFLCPMCDEATEALGGAVALAQEDGEVSSVNCSDCLDG
jgi:hypothetical protein